MKWLPDLGEHQVGLRWYQSRGEFQIGGEMGTRLSWGEYRVQGETTRLGVSSHDQERE